MNMKRILKQGGNAPSPSDDPFGGSKSMAIIYGNENIIDREQPVPASESEIKRLTKKEELCLEELGKRSSQGENESSLKGAEDKGKEKSN